MELISSPRQAKDWASGWWALATMATFSASASLMTTKLSRAPPVSPAETLQADRAGPWPHLVKLHALWASGPRSRLQFRLTTHSPILQLCHPTRTHADVPLNQHIPRETHVVSLSDFGTPSCSAYPLFDPAHRQRRDQRPHSHLTLRETHDFESRAWPPVDVDHADPEQQPMRRMMRKTRTTEMLGAQ
jgi:hypothetical protein